MVRVAIESSNLEEVGYDPGSRMMEILFRSGRLYHYYGVPSHVYEGLLAAPSAGSYFHAEIRGQYGDRRVS